MKLYFGPKGLSPTRFIFQESAEKLTETPPEFNAAPLVNPLFDQNIYDEEALIDFEFAIKKISAPYKTRGFGREADNAADQIIQNFESSLERQMLALGYDYTNKTKLTNYDQEELAKIYVRLQNAEKFCSKNDILNVFATRLMGRIEPILRKTAEILDPIPTISLTLDNPQRTKLHVHPLSEFNPIPTAGKKITPSQLHLGQAFTHEPMLNLETTMKYDDPETKLTHEGIKLISDYLVDEYFPANAEMLKGLKIQHVTHLTPKQAILLASAITMERIVYSQEQIRAVSINPSAQTSNEQHVNDNIPIDRLFQWDKSDDGNGVCRNYASVMIGVFEALKSIQAPRKSLLHNTYMLDNTLSPFADFPGHVQLHAWNEVLSITEDGVHACVIDATWADSDSRGADPARGSFAETKLDFTDERMLPMIRRFEDSGYLDPEAYLLALVEKFKTSGYQAARLYVNRITSLYKGLPHEKQKKLYDQLKTVITTLPEPENTGQGGVHIRFPWRPKLLEVEKQRLNLRFANLQLDHPELFTGHTPTSVHLEEAGAPNLINPFNIEVPIDISDTELLRVLKLKKKFSDTLKEVADQCEGKLVFSSLAEVKEENVDTFLRNAKDFFTAPERQYLFRFKSITISVSEELKDPLNPWLARDDFLGSYDPAKLVKALSFIDFERAKRSRQYLDTKRAMQEIEEDPRLDGVLNGGLEGSLEAGKILIEALDGLDNETQDYVKKHPVTVQMSLIAAGDEAKGKIKGRSYYLSQALSYRKEEFFKKGYIDQNFRVQKSFELSDYFYDKAADYMSIKRNGRTYRLVTSRSGKLYVSLGGTSTDASLRIGDEIIAQEDPAAELDNVLGNREARALEMLRGKYEPDIQLFLDNPNLSAEQIRKKIEQYVRFEKEFERARALGVEIMVERYLRPFVNPRDLFVLRDFVAELEAESELLKSTIKKATITLRHDGTALWDTIEFTDTPGLRNREHKHGPRSQFIADLRASIPLRDKFRAVSKRHKVQFDLYENHIEYAPALLTTLETQLSRGNYERYTIEITHDLRTEVNNRDPKPSVREIPSGGGKFFWIVVPDQRRIYINPTPSEKMR